MGSVPNRYLCYMTGNRQAEDFAVHQIRCDRLDEAQESCFAQLLIGQEMKRPLIEVELEAIASKGVNAKYQMDTNSEVCQIHDSCAETRQRTTADRCARDRNRRNLTRLSADANNPPTLVLAKTQLLYPPSQEATGVNPWMNARWVASVASAPGLRSRSDCFGGVG